MTTAPIDATGPAASRSLVEGPDWCEPGLLARAGRYPLAVEAPVMAAVDMLVPGVSTVTRYARYYSLYWALSAHAEDAGLDRDACRRLIRRAEVGMARISQAYDESDHSLGLAHGVEALARLGPDAGAEFSVADATGSRSYSPRAWGFWSQYNGPSGALGTATMDGGALRPGRHPCPPQITEMYAPLIAAAERGAGLSLPSAALGRLSLQQDEDTPDLEPLGSVFSATVDGRHDPEAWTGDDRTRRATLRILARSWQLNPDADTWLAAFAAGVAYGSAAREDPLLAGEERTAAWRGVVLRHHSVGAWRHLWAALVNEVRDAENASRGHLHDWIAGQLPGGNVADFEAGLPPVVDGQGDPMPAEEALLGDDAGVVTDVALLLLGARRLDSLTGLTLRTFKGRRPTYLDPTWVAQLRREFAQRPIAELGRRLVDDMLAQSRRVALRKVAFNPDGTISLFSRLHERNGVYFADSSEGSGNIGLRVHQLAEIAVQVGLLTPEREEPVTPWGRQLLEVPA
ncbi:hypothetical protein FHX75_1247 [Micromonospora palomenae]|uniref:Uncharacterized protein n=1 Tax=Micromonospora palomenae TaxID=1461247 RepID=A0A561WCE3_9ACTN|nr:hypothetical protein [Micromonospora palomenae]TWG21534.1 hypothetical protein FHX75_1247 [Micromonospora palomenae]